MPPPNTNPSSGDEEVRPAVAVLHLVGFERPLLESSIHHLLSDPAPRSGELRSLESTVVVVPGRRAGRRLLDGLVAEALARGEKGLSPPRVITPGSLPEVLFFPETPVASSVASRLAWLHAVETCPEELLAALGVTEGSWQGGAPSSLFRRQLELVEVLEGLREQLSLAALSEVEALERFRQRLDFADEARWSAVVELARRCDEELAHRGEMARARSRLALTCRGESHAELDRVVLVGIVELAPLFRRCLRRFEGTIESLVAAQAVPGLAAESRFDDLGCPRVDYWLAQTPEIERADLRVVDRPADQVAETVECVREWCDRGLEPRAITLGLADGTQMGAVEDGLRLAGLAAHAPVGRSFGASRPARLLEGLSRYLSGQRLADLGILVRHADLERWLEDGREEDPEDPRSSDPVGSSPPAVPTGGWATHIDRYVRFTLAQRLDSEPGAVGSMAEPLLALDRTLRSLAVGETVPRPLWRLPRRSLEDWCGSIARLLSSVFESPLSVAPDSTSGQAESRPEIVDLELEEALRMVGAALRSHLVAETGREGERRRWSFSEVVSLLHAELGEELLQPEPEREADAVELLGWLELALDDAPALVVMGLNEGTIPERVAVDPFLNDRLRGLLGLSHGRSRLARDRFLFGGLLEGRQLLSLVAGQRGEDDEPLAPSRLLLGDASGPDASSRRIAETLLAFYRDRAGGRSGSVPWRHADRLRIAVARPPIGARVPEPLRVTSFRDYVRCPYRFWLRHGARLESVDPAPEELDPRSFGTLGHEVLKHFAQTDGIAEDDPRAVRERLDDLLDAQVARRVGTGPPSATRLQVAQLRRRLHRFAVWQAEQVRSGWRIVAELSETDLESVLDVDGEPFHIRGRIDRVEHHDFEGTRLLDYKTADRALSPVRAHRGSGGDPAYRGWVDLQLPLYRELLRPHLSAEVDVGYCQLSADLEADHLALAPWRAVELDEATAVACEVARRVRAGRFWPPTPPVARGFPDGLEWICQDAVPAVRRGDSSWHEATSSQRRPAP